MTHWSDKLEVLNACEGAVDWAREQPSYEEAWDICTRGDWLLWLAGNCGVDRKLLALAACDCAELALVHIPEGEDRPRQAIETARKWANGDESISLDDIRQAADAAYAASNASNASNAAYAASNAAYAAYAAAAAADADAAHAAHAATRSETLKKCADLVRARIPRPELGGE